MRILLLCFTSDTDLILLVPVLRSLVRQFSKIIITLVCQPDRKSIFYNIPGVNIITADLNKEYIGYKGKLKLFNEIKNLGLFEHALFFKNDKTYYFFKLIFLFNSIKLHFVKRHYLLEWELTRQFFKKKVIVPHKTEMFYSAFSEIGLNINQTKLNNKIWTPWIDLETNARAEAQKFYIQKNIDNNIISLGIAPFSNTPNKNWPLEKVEALIKQINKELEIYVFVFGSKYLNYNKNNLLYNKFFLEYNQPKTILCTDIDDLTFEMALISRMKIFLSMDSIYMHLAALVGVPVYSIWGPTHPNAGNGAYKNETNQYIQIPRTGLNCRPCSLDGKKPCIRKDHACLEWISVSEVYNKIKSSI